MFKSSFLNFPFCFCKPALLQYSHHQSHIQSLSKRLCLAFYLIFPDSLSSNIFSSSSSPLLLSLSPPHLHSPLLLPLRLPLPPSLLHVFLVFLCESDFLILFPHHCPQPAVQCLQQGQWARNSTFIPSLSPTWVNRGTSCGLFQIIIKSWVTPI